MLSFDPDKWLAEYRQPDQPAETVADVATVAGTRPENEKPVLKEGPATPATPATLSRLGGDPASPFFVLDDDEGWIGESPLQTAARCSR